MKKALVLIITGLALVVSFWILYFWLLKPVKINITGIYEEELSWLVDMLSDLGEAESVYNGNYPDGLPSRDFHDYRKVSLNIDVKYRSFFKLISIQSVFEEFDSPESERIVWLYDGRLSDGEWRMENFCTKSMTELGFLVYVGDLKDEEEIKDIIYELLNSSRIRFFYNRQWVGEKEYSYDIHNLNAPYKIIRY